jgi:multidrug resistance protein MdtO
VFIVPGLTTIAGLLTIVAPVTFMAAWIAIGPQRFAYLGMQFGLAFYLVLLGVILVTLCMDGYRQGKRRE